MGVGAVRKSNIHQDTTILAHAWLQLALVASRIRLSRLVSSIHEQLLGLCGGKFFNWACTGCQLVKDLIVRLLGCLRSREILSLWCRSGVKAKYREMRLLLRLREDRLLRVPQALPVKRWLLLVKRCWTRSTPYDTVTIDDKL